MQKLEPLKFFNFYYNKFSMLSMNGDREDHAHKIPATAFLDQF